MQLSTEELYSQVLLPCINWLERHGVNYPWSFQQKSRLQSTDELPPFYPVWVSEVMLQQTRTAAVRPYYQAWMQKWPNLERLAAAREEEVLKAWEGLGYYNRAIKLHHCAKLLSKQEGLPQSAEELQTLPGIGPYIAAAIASISLNQAVLALDTNVLRILSRLTKNQPSPSQQRLWQASFTAPLSRLGWRGAGNIALIQLGQQNCLASKPLCYSCPLAEVCSSAGSEAWQEYPAKKARSIEKVTTERIIAFNPGLYKGGGDEHKHGKEPSIEAKTSGKIILARNLHKHLRHVWRLPSKELIASLCKQPIDSDALIFAGSFAHHYLSTREAVQVYELRGHALRALQHALASTSNCTKEANEGDEAQAQAYLDGWELRSFSLKQQAELSLAGPYRRFINDYLSAKTQSTSSL